MGSYFIRHLSLYCWGSWTFWPTQKLRNTFYMWTQWAFRICFFCLCTPSDYWRWVCFTVAIFLSANDSLPVCGRLQLQFENNLVAIHSKMLGVDMSGGLVRRAARSPMLTIGAPAKYCFIVTSIVMIAYRNTKCLDHNTY